MDYEVRRKVMKIGLKVFPRDLGLINKFRDIFDFFELFITPDLDMDLLKKGLDFNGATVITIHAAHFEYGFDMSDPKKSRLNEKILDTAISAANIVNSKWIIVHPGHHFNDNSETTMINFLEEKNGNHFDKRFIFENCPYVAYDEDDNKKKYLFSTPERMKYLLSRFKTKMVLDFGHAICTANILGKDPAEVIKEFMELGPRCFHLSGINIDSKIDEHKHLFEVNNDFSFVKYIGKSKFVTLETGYNGLNDRQSHLKNIEIINSIITTPS